MCNQENWINGLSEFSKKPFGVRRMEASAGGSQVQFHLLALEAAEARRFVSSHARANPETQIPKPSSSFCFLASLLFLSFRTVLPFFRRHETGPSKSRRNPPRFLRPKPLQFVPAFSVSFFSRHVCFGRAGLEGKLEILLSAQNCWFTLCFVHTLSFGGNMRLLLEYWEYFTLVTYFMNKHFVTKNFYIFN